MLTASPEAQTSLVNIQLIPSFLSLYVTLHLKHDVSEAEFVSFLSNLTLFLLSILLEENVKHCLWC